jgi:hypothetical protein
MLHYRMLDKRDAPLRLRFGWGQVGDGRRSAVGDEESRSAASAGTMAPLLPRKELVEPPAVAWVITGGGTSSGSLRFLSPFVLPHPQRRITSLAVNCRGTARSREPGADQVHLRHFVDPVESERVFTSWDDVLLGWL